ncbi:MAG TPA: hypothetical protein VHN80_30280 [Kineosporiaceae bacterium]|nr:hypothetical protein [Kineosporiaceae bacterium]
MRIFYDTEFLEDGRTIELISIGMVADDGRELYLVNRDAPWDRVRDHPWLMANVVPLLPQPAGGDPVALVNAADPVVQPRRAIAAGVGEFVRATPDPELWAWYAAYDHVALCQLFGRMVDLPDGIPRWTNDLQQAIRAAGSPVLPPAPDDAHHALADARFVRLVATRLRV